jgi:cyclohexanone monooxygenase
MSLPQELVDPGELGFDPQAIMDRYGAERAKRMRTDGQSQFIEIGPASKYARYLLEDHYAGAATDRAPLTDEVEFLVIGGGWAGLMMAARLKQAGIDDVRIVDAGSDFGGTWYWNRYPGAQCDVQSYVYMPLLEETGYIPKERYAFASELLEHARRIGEHFGLYENAVFRTWVTDVRWDEKTLRWIVTTNAGDRMRARFVGIATGPASRPRLPGIPGIDDYKGHSFHTSRWDYDYTGGGPEGGLDRLADKRVAVIGTGATAIQCVAHVAAGARQTYVFQRTPSSVAPRGNAPTDPEWVQSLQPGWQRKMMAAFDRTLAGIEVDEQLLETEGMFRTFHHIRNLMAKVDPESLTPEEMQQIFQLGDHATAEEIRRRVEETVQDPAIAEVLKHWYYGGCKRPTFNDEYLEAFNRPNVSLIDVSDAKGIDRITEHGVVANGVEYEVDCIIYASGFEITSDFEKRLGIPVFGQGGKSIYDHWRDGMRSAYGVMVHGFPNLFMVGGLFCFTLSLNYSGTLEDQTELLTRLVHVIRQRGDAAQPTLQAEEEWIKEQIEAPPTILSSIFGGAAEACTPGYYTLEGTPMAERRDIRREGYAPGGTVYAERFRSWVNGNLAGLEFMAS